MGEDKENINTVFPVIVKGMKIRWFIRDQEGREFLEAILYNNDLSLYKIVTLEMIIEYMYRKFKNFLFIRMLPLFFMRLFFFYSAMFINEYTGDSTALGNVTMKQALKICFGGQAICELYAVKVIYSQFNK